MKSSCQKEEPDNKKGYVFFSDPDVIVKRAESSAIAAQIRWDSEAQRQVPEKPSANLPASELGTKGLENFLSFYPVQPYPFTFISAIKQKLALGNHSDISAKPSDLNTQARNDLTSLPLVTNCKQKVYQVAEKMDLFRPLKVPDLKISPKTLDFSSRENSISRELSSSKSEIATKELAHDRPDKIKIGERVQRKLDFSLSDGPSTISCDNIEPLKVPNVSIASNLSKKKEHARDNSREKENRSKRIKKDDSLCVKKDETAQDQVKRSRSPRHVSRRDTIENMSGIIATKSKNDRLPFHTTKNNDSLSMKSKMKNFVTSTARKDNEKRQRTFNAQSVELTKDFPLESKGRIHGNKALDFVSWKIPDKVTTREISGSVAILSSNIENKFKDICHSRVEDLKYKCDSDNRQFLLKQDKPNITHKEQAKRVSDKSKISSNKIEGNIHNANSEPSEDIECLSETNSSKNRACIYPASSAQQSKSEDTEATMESKQNVNSNRSSKMLCSYTEHSPAQSTSENINKDEESYSQSVTTGQMTINDDSNNIDSVLPDELFDPRRISFRDSSYSQQDEFHNLATPDKIDFTSRVKQRRYLQSRDSEVDARCSKYKSTAKSEKEQEKIQLRHPEALRMTLQAECEFFESLNEACKSVKEVEKCLHNIKRDQKQKNPQIESEKDEEAQIGEIRVVAAVDNDAEKTAWKPSDYVKKDVTDIRKSHICDEALFIKDHYIPNQTSTDELSDNFKVKVVKVAEVQTQTVNDMATQTESYVDQCNAQNRSEIHESMCERSLLGENEIYQLLLNSTGEREDQYQIEEISLPSRITMSEISLHETTSSIKTETGNEISISTRDLKCSFKNKAFKELIHLDISQQIKDEKERYDKLEMLFKTREKNLNDKTKKLVKLEEQKRALKDTGQDSRISSVKKKQRALLLKLKEEQDEMNRLKELHEIASQERKLMLQKQKDMFNPQLSTKNILSKLKRSADSQSPRRLSGPMKGYDIRSNSSISSPYGFSDKSQHDRSQADARLQASESDAHLSRPDLGKSDRFENLAEESNTSATRFDDLAESNESHEESSAKLQRSDVRRYELKSRKYEEKMPKADILRQKQNQRDLESKRIHGHSMKMKRLMENQKPIDESQLQSRPELDTLSADHVKSESDTLVEELSKRSKPSQIVDPSVQTVTNSKEKELIINTMTANNESVEDDVNSNVQDIMSKAMKLSQISEDLLHAGSKNSKKTDKSITSDRDHANKKLQHGAELKTNSKRKNSKHLKTKSSSYALEKLVKHHDKRTKMDNESLQLDNNNESSILDELYLNDSQNSLHTLVRHSRDVKEKNMKLLSEVINNYESKSNQASNRRSENNERLPRNERTDQNAPTSRFSAFTISHQSSEESEKNLSVVLRSQNKDFKESKKLEQLEQILSAREAALVSRKNTVEEWMAWHTRLRTEEERVTRMEQATLKIAAATSNVLSQQDTTVSSDMSDVEGRIEMLTEKLAERRIEMSRLKREARRQTKQKLRAMEANLLNQIKRYDTTIHDMRKKLESKKAIKDSDKLAIEPKSLADFKVPEIPLKRIQDIYKSSDLLRSRSESDLLLTRVQQKDLLKIITHAAYYDSQERYNSQKSVRSVDSRSVNASELKSSTNRSDHSAFEDCTSTEARNKVQTVTSSSLSNDARTERRTVTALETDEKRSDESILDEWKRNNVSHDAEDVRTIASTMRSEQEVRTISDAKSEDYGGTINAESVNDGPISHAILDQSHSRTRSEIPEELTDVDHSRSVLSKSVHTVASSAHEALSFSEKLNFLQLNNKNLNENISSLENGLKVLSEMMSRFSDKPSEKPNRADEKSTSYDISEIKSVFSDRLVSVEDEGGKTVSFEEREIDSEPFSVLTTDRRSKSSNDLSHEKHTEKMNSDEISALIPDMAPGGLTSSVHEIDYEAKSKEIMNEIEKSILSENSKVARGDYNVSSVLENDMQNLHKGNEELLNDLISLELDIKSISEILSKVSESRKSLGLATNTASQIINGSKVDANELSDQHEADLEEETPAKDQTCASHSPKLSERSVFTISSHSPIIAGHRSKENSKSKSQRSAITSGSPRVLADESLKRSDNILEELHETETTAVGDARIETPNETKRDDVQRAAYDDTVNSTTLASNVEQNQSRVFSVDNASVDKDDWTTSDSFEVPQSEISTGEGRENSEAKDSKSRSDDINDATNNLSNMKDASRVESTTGREAEVNLTNVDVSAFIPKGESTNIDVRDVTFINTTTESHARKDDVLDDILSIIARESNREENIRDNKNEQLDNVISDSMADLLNQVEVIVAHNDKSIDSLKGILCDNAVDIPVDKRSIVEALSNETQTKINVEDISGNNIGNIDNYDKPNDEEKAADTSLRASSEVDEKSAININLHVEIDNEGSLREMISEAQEIIITELDSDSIEDHALPELEIDAKVELAEDEESVSAKSDAHENEKRYTLEKSGGVTPVEVQEFLEPILEQDSSDGEQMDNLVEVIESGLVTIEKIVTPLRASAETETETVIDHEEVPVRVQKEAVDDMPEASQSKGSDKVTISARPVVDLNKTFDILKDPDYEDISEESLEVSEILDKNELSKTGVAKKSISLPDKYQATQKSDEVLRILDEISQKSSPDSTNNSQKDEKDALSAQSATEEISELIGVEVSAEDTSSPEVDKMKNKIGEEFYKGESKDQFLEEAISQERRSEEAENATDLVDEKSSGVSSRLDERLQDKSSQIIYELRERVSRLQEQDGSSESSEAGDTPRGVSEIEMDSPRDFNDSRLDIDILDDDLLSGTKTANQNVDVKTNFHSASIVATSEKDIEAMIYKLKASLEQPGLEVAELEAKLLRIEQLEIELEIKKLEAEEVSYYVREIPNKPPPPYTPPGDGRLSTSLGSPSLLTAVIPSNVDELTSFTEKAMAIIYNAKIAGEDIANLETPAEMHELAKEKNEIMRKDKRIYNNFLFDLCKEIVADVYRAEYEKPGPSWTKPNVKTKPTVKIPKTVEGLTEYVSKEVATLFGFKTKLQRENMVMRWSRKRRDRVDELLAREAQAEEDEWTKFHHDELAVKNGLTVAILDTLVMETVNVVKIAYGKKRRLMV